MVRRSFKFRLFMHLRALILNGFKSFADKTELHFEPGVTAVVGPNGCGKSNIADAIRWVLGEQSAKALRGGKMQDVIFEGTDGRKPVQICEVSMLLSECEEQLGSQFNEIEITRRVSRDGNSGYYLNGKACRLKDIHQLFMDTGVGRTSYSIMAQGQIDQILSSKPEERRAVFEEAAGITKYKSQRKEALNKLALVDANLSRVTDVIQEVSRQIGSLRRQASKAVRYKKLSHRLNHLHLAKANFQHGVIKSSIDDLEKRANDETSDVDQYQAELSEKEASLSQRKIERQTLNEQIQGAQQAVFDLRSQKEQALNEGQLAEIKKNSLSERIEQAKVDLVSIESQLGEIAEKVNSGEQDKQLHLDILGGSDEIFQVRHQELEEIEAKLRTADDDLRQTKGQLIEAENSATRLREEGSTFEIEEKTNANRYDHLLKELADQEEAEKTAKSSLEEFRENLASVGKEKEEISQQLEAAREKTVSLSGGFRNVQVKIQESDRGVAQKTARLKLLQQLQEKFEGFGEGAKALLQGRLGEAYKGQGFKPVTSGLIVESGYEKGVEALLGSAVEAISVTNADTARAILTQFEEEKIGAGVLCFPTEGAGESSGVDLPAFLKPAFELVSFSSEDSRSTSLLKTLLSGCYLVDNSSDFLTFWKENGKFDFLFVATRSGELIDGRGLLYGGYRKGGNKSILQRESELRQITKEIEVEQKVLQSLRTEADTLNKSLEESEKSIESARQQLSEIDRKSSILQAEERNAERSLEDLASRRARLEQEQALVVESREKNAERLKGAQDKLSEAESRLIEFREKIGSIEDGLIGIREDRDSRRESLAQARFDLAEKRQKLDTLSQGLTEMEQRKGSLQLLESSRNREIVDWTEQIGLLEAEAQNKIAEGEIIAGKQLEAQETVEKVRISVKEVEGVIQTLEQEQAVLRDRSEGRRSALSQSQIKLAEERSRLHFLSEEVTREHQIDLMSVNWRRELWSANQPPEGLKPQDLDDVESSSEDEDESEESEKESEVLPTEEKVLLAPTKEELSSFDEVNWGDVSTEVDALRKRIQTIGPVNLVAIEEYSELKERFEFLKTQSEDLISSKNELLQAIDQINETSQKQFAETFDKIRENFVQTFKTLFGGGKAGLELIESEDILESGIEIVAQPPGTKLKSISLLSGGQRTMTAVGLLFAIYMVKPSPFCVLDELDAPLDESNIGRFTELLKQFTQNSQFIIITHNKRTIAASEAIYGVTMEEKGVSKIISMRFHSDYQHHAVAEVASDES
jgi:chromosome segregation protein